MKSKHWKRNMMKFFQGASMGTVVGVIPSAILGTVTAPYVGETGLLGFFARVVVAFQFAVPFLVGYFTALEFQLSAIETAVLVGSSFIGSGILKFSGGSWILQGTGDLLNTMLTVAVSVCAIKLYNNRYKDLNIVLLPLLGGILPGGIGRLCLPKVSALTGFLGQGVKQLTTVQPLIMAIVIAVAFALIIMTPLSTVAIAYAISLTDLAAGAAGLGIVASLFTLFYASCRVNTKGISFSLLFAGPKLFMANYLDYLIMTLPIVLNASVVGIFAYLFHIQGSTQSAGFGIVGLSGPMTSYSFMEGPFLVKLGILSGVYVGIPLGIAALTHTLLTRVGLYSDNIFRYAKIK